MDKMKKIKGIIKDLSDATLEHTADRIKSEFSAIGEDNEAQVSFFAVVGDCIIKSAEAPGADTSVHDHAMLHMKFVLEVQNRLDEKTVKRALLTAIQQEYEQIWGRKTIRVTPPDSEPQDQPVIEPEHRLEWLGFNGFLGLLYVNGVVAEKVLRSVLDRFADLRGSPDENLIEGTCTLLLTDGVVYKLFSTERGETFIKQWKGLPSLRIFSKIKNLSGYVDLKPMFESVILLVDNKGVGCPRHNRSTKSSTGTPKTGPSKSSSADSPSHDGGGGPGRGGKGRATRSDHAPLPVQENSRFDALKDSHPSSPDESRRGKGNRGTKGDKGVEKGDPSLPDPRQLFVAGIGGANEDEVRAHFQLVGEVARVKVLPQKDVCFVTFKNDEQAVKALALHGTMFSGGRLTVKVANGKKGTEKGVGKGSPSFPSSYSPSSPTIGPGFCLPPPCEASPELGSSRFDVLASGLSLPPPDRSGLGDDAGKGKGKGTHSKGGGKGKNYEELDALLQEQLEKAEGPLQVSDFDWTAKRFLLELRVRDRTDSTTRFDDAVQYVIKNTGGKDRSSVKKWPAYVFKLLERSDEDFFEEFKKRDEERRLQRNFTPSDRTGRDWHDEG